MEQRQRLATKIAEENNLLLHSTINNQISRTQVTGKAKYDPR